MEPLPLDPAWASALLLASSRESEEQYQRFLELVDRAAGRITRSSARTLLHTFSAKPDHGTQERVCSVLATGDRSIVVDAILEELPRLMEQAREWAEVLMGEEVESRPHQTSQAISRASMDSRLAALQLLRDTEFAEFFPSARQVLAHVGA